MGRLRVRRLPPGTHDLLLKLTNRHVHAQIVDRAAGTVLVAVHTTEPVVHTEILGPDHPRCYGTASVEAAGKVGTLLAERALAKGITNVSWQRPGKYHGKIKAFLDSIRASGLQTFRPYPPHPQLSPKGEN